MSILLAFDSNYALSQQIAIFKASQLNL